MTKSERTRAAADKKAAAYLGRIPKRLRDLPVRFELPGKRGLRALPRGPLSPFEWALYALHRTHHLAAHPEYDADWRRPAPEVAEALARRLGLRLDPYVIERAWLRPDERSVLRTRAAQAAVAVLAAGIAVGRQPYVVWRGENEEPQPNPVFLSPNRVFAALAGGWSDHFRQSPAERVEDLREETLRACRRDLVRNGLKAKALWRLATRNPLYSARRQRTVEGDYAGGYTVRFKDEALVALFVKELEASGFRLHEHGRRLLLDRGQRLPPVERRPSKQEIAAEWLYNVVKLGSRSATLIRTLERARLQFHAKVFADAIRRFKDDADDHAKQFRRKYGKDAYEVLRWRRDKRQEFFDDLPAKRRDAAYLAWDEFKKVATPATLWKAAAEQVSLLPDTVTIRSQFERVINRRWEAVHLWPGDASEAYRTRWFSASDGGPLCGLDVSASQTQILAVFLGLPDLERQARSVTPRFNQWLAELVWGQHRKRLKKGYTGKDDGRLIALVKTLWMRVLYGKPAKYVAADQREEPGTYGPGWAGKTDKERGRNAQEFLKAVPSYPDVTHFLDVCEEVARVAYERDRIRSYSYRGVVLADPFDEAEVRWHPIRREPKVIHGLCLMVPAYQEMTFNQSARRKVPAGPVKFTQPNTAGDYPVDAEKMRKMVAPCLVHMLDAFFAGLVINGLARAGVRDLVSIHDCWLVPQAHKDALDRCIKDAGRPWLEGLGVVYDTLIGYLVGTKHEAFARQIKATWEDRVARADWPVFSVRPAK